MIRPNIYDCVEQGSPAWFELRRGVLTASNASSLLTPTGRPSSSVKALRARLLADGDRIFVEGKGGLAVELRYRSRARAIPDTQPIPNPTTALGGSDG